MKRIIFTSFFIFFTVLLWSEGMQAQSVKIDSLKAIMVSSGVANGDRIEAMEQLSRILIAQNELDEALEITREAQQLSHREEDGKYGALVQSTLSYLYAQQDSLRLAFQALDSAEWYVDRTTDKAIKGRIMHRRGWLEYIVENTDKAYQSMLEALRLLEGEDTYVYQSNIYHFLAAIYAHWKKPEKQLYYTRLCLNAALKSNDPDAITNAYLSMGSSTLNRFRKDQSRKELLDSSAYFNKLVIKLTDSLQQRLVVKSTGGIAALNMANLYLEFYPASYQDSAKVYLKRALSIGKATNHPEIIGNSYGILSEFALREGDYGRADNLLQMALREISASPKSGTLIKSRISNALARVAEKKGNHKQALDYYKQYVQFDKALFDEEKLAITQKLEAQFQSEKRELALSAAMQEAAFTKQLNRFYILLIIAGAIALFFLFRSYHFRLKTSQQRQLLLTGQKHEAELQASLKAEETARLQTERELMQERLDRLEKELLAGTLQVEEKNALLQNLREKLNTLDGNDPLHRQINRLISENHQIDKGYDEIKVEFAEIRPEFIAGLQQKAENKLTRLDLKYCAYILMGLTNKEVASKLNVAPKSIRMAHYRIKQKLKLEKEENLDRFIRELGEKSVL
ncbi:transcriptional regulator [Echinicola soli]|nr:LuxR C-terminal-related transcriptional regulator [Echinicola soli]